MNAKHFILALWSVLVLASCADSSKPVDTTKNQTSTDESQAVANAQTAPQTFTEDAAANELAQFLAGTSQNPAYAQKEFYKKHSEIVTKEWASIEENTLLPIRTWARENNITSPADTLTMIYPFSGPDFLYANTFFPYCKNYIMIGLEKSGNMPDLKNVPDNVLDAYLENIRHSLRYINKKGYFVTSQMKDDFSKNKLDGTLHLLLYYMAQTGNRIISVSDFYLDQYGKPNHPQAGHVYQEEIRGIHISFYNPKRNYPQDVYYLPFNLADANVARKSEFLYFVNNFGPKIFYTKSASYILHDAQFSTIRKLLLDQSKKVLQDDTGIPYFLMDDGNFRLTLYGEYTRTINDFNQNFQPNLKEALAAQPKKLFLPFKIGYNAWFNETVLIYGEAISPEEKQQLLAQRSQWRKEQEKKQVADEALLGTADAQLKTSHGILFRIQFFASNRKRPLTDPAFRGLAHIGYYISDGKICYTLGNATTADQLSNFQKTAVAKGFAGAFVVAFRDGKRISIAEAQDKPTK